MIAAFLKNDDGDFNYPVAMFSAFLLFVISLTILQLRRALYTGRIWFTYGYMGSSRFWIYREKNPFAFWFVFTICCLVYYLVFL
jgi:hypothetical protein